MLVRWQKDELRYRTPTGWFLWRQSKFYTAKSTVTTRAFTWSTGNRYVVAKTLGDVQEILETHDFVRVHRHYMVNLEHIQKLVKGEGTYLLMTNNASIPVARQQKDRLMERFGWV